MRIRLAAGVLLALFVTLAPALAQDRLALVVGIDRYAKLAPLQKAGNDARAVNDTLTRLGFRVDLVVDADRRGFNRALSNFLNKITPGAIVYFHYSGHGVSIDNDTFLLPSDTDVPGAGDREFVKREAVRLSEVIDSMKTAKARSRILVIDACRDNPFAQRGVRSIGATRGLALLPAPEGTLILYSAADGQSALDTLGPNDREPTSVYTRTLLKHLATPGRSVVATAREVRREVEQLAKSIGHEQRPAYYDELNDDLVLHGGSTAPAPAVPTTVPVAPAPAPPAGRAPAPPPGALQGVDMPGNDYRNFDLPAADAALCQTACRGETRCAAWTYVQPGLQGPSARCWLKTRVPQRITHTCCTSGIERR